MKKILFFLLLIISIDKIYAKYIPMYEYSEFSPEYPTGYDERFIDSEDRYLWYKDIEDPDTGEITRETTTEYYAELEGYTRIDESVKTFYRYITSEYVLLDGNGRLVEDENYCVKDYCTMLYITIPEDEEIENPKTGDITYTYLTVTGISLIVLIGIEIIQNKKSI